jgi:hypothetical protein
MKMTTQNNRKGEFILLRRLRLTVTALYQTTQPRACPAAAAARRYKVVHKSLHCEEPFPTCGASRRHNAVSTLRYARWGINERIEGVAANLDLKGTK